MILSPPQPISPLIAVITTQDTTISTILPAKDARFNDRVKALGYTWAYPACVWQRRINEMFNGSTTDRLIELAHTLLLVGFSVDVPDEFLTYRIAAGDYAPEVRRWVKKYLPTGWFQLDWPRSDDFWHRAKHIPGCRYEPPLVLVPPDAYLEVQDFADQYGFKLSPGAQAICDAMSAKRRSVVITQVQPKSKTSTLPAPSGVIAEALRDTDD